MQSLQCPHWNGKTNKYHHSKGMVMIVTQVELGQVMMGRDGVMALEGGFRVLGCVQVSVGYIVMECKWTGDGVGAHNDGM